MRFTFEINQKEALRQGFDSNSTQVIEVPADQIPADVREVVADYYQPSSGMITGSIKVHPKLPLTVESAIDAMREFAAKVKDSITKANADEQRRRQRTLEATAAVLNQRKTKSASGLASLQNEHCSYWEVYPDWPYESDRGVLESPEAKAWMSDLGEQNAAAKKEAFKKLEARLEKLREVRNQEDALICQNGTASQIERLHAGRLPKNERDEIINEVLFAPIRAAGYGLVPENIPCESSGKDVELDAAGWEAHKELAAMGQVTETRRYVSHGEQTFGFVVEMRHGDVCRSQEFSKDVISDASEEDE